MEPVLEHLREYYVAYAVIGLTLLPLLYVTRRWSVPAIAYVIEYVLYLVILHTVLYVVLHVARWFKESSAMEQAFDRTVTVQWTMPFLEFWKRELYTPGWIFWLQAVAAVATLILMWRIRPMRVQQRSRRKTQQVSKGRKGAYQRNTTVPGKQPSRAPWKGGK